LNLCRKNSALAEIIDSGEPNQDDTMLQAETMSIRAWCGTE